MKIIILAVMSSLFILGCKEEGKSSSAPTGKKLDNVEAEVKATLALRQRLSNFKEIKFDKLECYESSKNKASCTFEKLAITVPHGSFLGYDKKDENITNIYSPLTQTPSSFSQGDRVLFSGSFSLLYQKPSFSNKEGAPKLSAINLKLKNQEKAK